MRCLQQSDQKSDPDRAQPGNLLEKRAGGMLPAFRQQLLPRLFPYPHQEVKLLIEPLGATTYACFPQFLQPGSPLT